MIQTAVPDLFVIVCTETLVTSVGISPFSPALQPADAALFIDIKLRHIGFDIQYWRSIKQVHAQHNQPFFGHRLETQYRQTDGIGPLGGAGGKETTLFGIEKGGHYKVVAAVGMQMAEHIALLSPYGPNARGHPARPLSGIQGRVLPPARGSKTHVMEDFMSGIAFAAGGAAGSAPAAGGVAMMGQILPIILIFAVFYFLLIRPQQKKAKEGSWARRNQEVENETHASFLDNSSLNADSGADDQRRSRSRAGPSIGTTDRKSVV